MLVESQQVAMLQMRSEMLWPTALHAHNANESAMTGNDV